MTEKQKKIFLFIKNFINKKGYSPTNDEIKEAVGLKSKPMVNHYLNSLELLGKISRVKYHKRGIRLSKEACKEETAQQKLDSIILDLETLSTHLCLPDEDMEEQIAIAYKWTNEILDKLERNYK